MVYGLACALQASFGVSGFYNGKKDISNETKRQFRKIEFNSIILIHNFFIFTKQIRPGELFGVKVLDEWSK